MTNNQSNQSADAVNQGGSAMSRFKLFLFYFVMAIASVVNPKEGQLMIDAANEGAELKRKREAKRHYEKLLRIQKS